MKFTAVSDEWSGMVHLARDEHTKRLCLLGWVTYEDVRKQMRTTYFCREWDEARNRFYPTNEPDSEATY